MKIKTALLTTSLVLIGGVATFAYVIQAGLLSGPHGVGEVSGEVRPVPATEKASSLATDGAEKQILFGDLHVHSTFSMDAHMWSLPLFQGTQGTHPVADACDFARFCSALDFFSINDHAESLSARMWQQTQQSIQQCNAAADPEYPDVVAFTGYEWTQVGNNPGNHYGHKNVLFLETDSDQLPRHPIASGDPEQESVLTESKPGLGVRLMVPLSQYPDWAPYLHYSRYIAEAFSMEPCQSDVPLGELPEDCRLYANTPKQLFNYLDDWGGEALVIPHGNAWGYYTPPGSSWDKQLKNGMHDPDRQRLVEIFSGHGNSEEYRPWREARIDENGQAYCPPASADFTPECRRAAEVVHQRCTGEGKSAEQCEQLAAKAMSDFLASDPVLGFMSVPGLLEKMEDAGQCKDCWLPPFRHRPGSSSQYALAVRNFDDPEKPQGFDFGFIASSDNHRARPGTGYKAFYRHGMSESAAFSPLIKGKPLKAPETASSQVWNLKEGRERVRASIDLGERQASYYTSGGLVAVHAENRSREAIWEALKSKEVYGTSGQRFSLWFDLVDPDDAGSSTPMGGHRHQTDAPTFRVKALGDFKQKPGCPDYVVNRLAPERLEKLCLGECYNPSNERQKILRIEVIRIQPQQYKNEPVEKLIQDVWKRFDCPANGRGCEVEFTDPDYEKDQRDTFYYVRAIGEPVDFINGAQEDFQYDDEGNYIGKKPCDIASNSTCAAKAEPRAWSSPIFVHYPG